MPTTPPQKTEIEDVLTYVAKEAAAYLATLDERPVRSADAETVAGTLVEPFPEVGKGTAQTLQLLIEKGTTAAVHSGGPRFFHFVVGGVTPAALGADWIATLFDQVAYAWVTSPLAVKLELISLDWLKDLFQLPAAWSGIMTTGATMANFVGLAAARQWWGEQHGTDIAAEGMAGLPAVPVFSSGHIHPSALKALAMLGIGRNAVQQFAADMTGRLDLSALETALQQLNGAPCIIIGNAGEVNVGDFDPIDSLADLAQRYNAWYHIDGAFGLFARVSPRTYHLAAGAERADSVTVDGHKWLNVPYDCGFSFVRDHGLMNRAFAYTAAYLPQRDDLFPNMGIIGPESSRRARSLAVWATLRAYGRTGCRAMIEQHLDLALYLAQLIDAAPELERLAEVQLNIVCFRYNPGGLSPEELNRVNTQLGAAILEDGRVYTGITQYKGMTALRPAIVNWRTEKADIQVLVEVVRELGQRAQ